MTTIVKSRLNPIEVRAESSSSLSLNQLSLLSSSEHKGNSSSNDHRSTMTQDLHRKRLTSSKNSGVICFNPLDLLLSMNAINFVTAPRDRVAFVRCLNALVTAHEGIMTSHKNSNVICKSSILRAHLSVFSPFKMKREKNLKNLQAIDRLGSLF